MGMDTNHTVGTRTVGSETREGADSSIVNILGPKTIRRVGCWNVRTLYQAGRLAQVVREMENYRISLLGVSETRWTGTGIRQLATGHHIAFSGRSDSQHDRGVALIVNKEVHRSMIEWKPINERLMSARFNSTYAKLTVIVCYAPTEPADDIDKDAFYDKLQETIENTPVHDVLLVLGDFNAKVGQDNTGRESTMGRHGCGTRNDNGERLVELCEGNNLVIGGTVFKHKDIHKWTWTSPDDRTNNQIDHILINRRWRGSLQDVRAWRGADVGSDHTLVIAEMKLKLRKAKKPSQRKPRLDVDKLKDPLVKRSYQLELRNRFNLLSEQQELDIDSFNQGILEAGEKVLGFKRRKREEWISRDTWSTIDKRKETKKKLVQAKSERLKQQLKATYSALDKEVKRKTKVDKKVYIDNLATEAELATARNDMSTLYKITKTLTGGFSSSDAPVKNGQGEVITNSEEKVRCWKEHFEQVLNCEDPATEANIQPAEVTLDINTGPPTIEETRAAIKKLKNGKAPGIDRIQAELLKAEEHMTPTVLSTILGKIWNSETAPEDWKVGLIVKLPKKGDLTDCNNWRGIMLLSVASKVLSRIILNRITNHVDQLLRKNQSGFRKGKSCADHIFTLRQIIEQSHEWNATIYANFIDFAKAFDSVHRPALWKILCHYGFPDKIIALIKMLYTDFSAHVVCGTELTESFRIKTGVKQGCLLSPLLFSLCIDWLMKETTKDGSQGLQWTFTESLEDLDFADDIALLAQRYRDIQAKTDNIDSHGRMIGLTINTRKTKIMRINPKTDRPVTINNANIKEVEEFVYLGSKVTIDGNSEEDVKARISKARGTFAALRPIWNSSKLCQKTKLRIFKSNVLGVLLYGSESWKVTQSICHKLDVFQTRCLRRILHIFWPNTISNQAVHRRTDTSPLSVEIRRRRWRWIGHVLRMENTAIPRVAMRWTPPGKRRRGRPKETWRRSVEKEMKEKTWSWGQLQAWAGDRLHWRTLVKALCADQREED